MNLWGDSALITDCMKRQIDRISTRVRESFDRIRCPQCGILAMVMEKYQTTTKIINNVIKHDDNT